MRQIRIGLMFFLVLLAAGSGAMNAAGASPAVLSPDIFRRMIILEDGRKKPLDTFARNMLKQFSGRSRYRNGSAVRWLSRLLFSPEKADRDAIFLIAHPEVLNALGVDVTDDRDRYSFVQLEPSLAELKNLAFNASRLEGKERSLVENEIILLYNKIYLYQELKRGFQFVRPDPHFTVTNPVLKQGMGLPGDQDAYSFLDMMKGLPELNRIRQGHGPEPADTDAGLKDEARRLFESMQDWLGNYRESTLSIVYLPENGKEIWLSPWQTLDRCFRNRSPVPEDIFSIAEFVRAFHAGDQSAFDQSVGRFNNLIIERLRGVLSSRRVHLEILYNRIDPFYRAQFLYGGSLLLLLLSFMVFKKWFYRLGFFLLLAGFFLHLFGLICRIWIMQRPPATNLYETFVFTGWITVLIGIILELLKKRNIGILTGGISGVIMLLIAGKYALEGDTMGMLVAVLDSNFWLSTHVITITVGFAGIVISGVIGHIYVFQKIWVPDRAGKDRLLKNTFQSVYATQAFGLIFTFLGTVLGGMWADQSWGRFWGWDPKENGALIVVIWSIILFHSRLSRWMGENGFSLGAIAGTITVALSWFGINLLGVGLHSYGFTSGIALALLIFIGIEFLFVLFSVFFIRRKGLL